MSPNAQRPASRVLPAAASFQLRSVEVAATAEEARVPVLLLEREAASLDELLEQARLLGIEEGRSAAIREATDLADQARGAAAMSVAGHLEAAARQVASERQALLDGIVGEAVDLVVELLETLVGEELTMRPDPLRDALGRALQLAPPDEALTVRLNPESALDPEELRALAPGHAFSVVIDASVDPGGCIVEAGPCRIDAQLSTALERVRQELNILRRSTGNET